MDINVKVVFLDELLRRFDVVALQDTQAIFAQVSPDSVTTFM